MKSVLLVDDHPVVAFGLNLAFRKASLFKLSDTAVDAASCLAKIKTGRPDALVLDLVFDGTIQTDLISRCRVMLPDAAIVVFSSLPEELYGGQALAFGADAYLNKSSDLSVLCELLAELAYGRALLKLKARTLDPSLDHILYDGVHLTQREAEIAKYVGRGFSIDAIATELGIKANTAAVHRDNLRKKLDCRNTRDLIARLARLEGVADGRT